MQTAKEVYSYLAENFEIFLPTSELKRVVEKLKDSKNIFSALYEIENDPHLQKFKDKSKGSFRDFKPKGRIKKGVQQIEPGTGKVIAEYDSLYQAAKEIGVPKGFGNIHKAVKTGSVAYGFEWK